MDRITLNGIEVYALGGVSEAERAIGQRYRVDVELELDLNAAAASDLLKDTISYARVHEVVVGTMRERPFNLLEAVTARIADRVLASFPVERVLVRCAKLLPPIDGVVASAAVEIVRSRSSSHSPT
jgi:dihydroneopterin aldolase